MVYNCNQKGSISTTAYSKGKAKGSDGSDQAPLPSLAASFPQSTFLPHMLPQAPSDSATRCLLASHVTCSVLGQAFEACNTHG